MWIWKKNGYILKGCRWVVEFGSLIHFTTCDHWGRNKICAAFDHWNLKKRVNIFLVCWLHLTGNDTLKFWVHIFINGWRNFVLFTQLFHAISLFLLPLLCRPPPPYMASIISSFVTHMLLPTLACMHFILLLHSCSLSSLNWCPHSLNCILIVVLKPLNTLSLLENILCIHCGSSYG